MRLILASGSPRRKEILAEIAPDFGVVPAAGEERADLSLPPSEIVCALARAKAKEVFAKFPDCAVLGADTIVWFRGRALGKPKDEGEAAATLRALSANEHEVCSYTGSFSNIVGLPKEEVREKLVSMGILQ